MDSQDPIILNPESGSLAAEHEHGAAVLLKASTLGGSGSGVLDNVPPDGDVGAWTKGRTVHGDCDIWYHHSLKYNPNAHEACLVGCNHDFLERRLR